MNGLEMNELRKFALILVLLVAGFTASATYECPKDCECIVIQGARPQNHAKCSSLEGLHNVTHLPIHSIDLSHIAITKMGSILLKLRDLVSVDISNNHLSEIPHVPRRVHSLKLSHNKIHSDKLAHLNSHIKHLDLSHNEITNLPLSFKDLANLKSLELTGNKIKCSCETLEVRNWLQDQTVFTGNHIKCALPQHVRGKPWLQIKQSEICEFEKQQETDNENDLMLGDEPMHDDEIGEDFIMVPKSNKRRQVDSEKEVENPKEQVEGSGDSDVHLMEHKEEDEEEDDGSGSGGGPIHVDVEKDSEHDIHKSDDDFLPEEAYNNSEIIVPTLANPTLNEDPLLDFEKYGMNITDFDEQSSSVAPIEGAAEQQPDDETTKIKEASSTDGSNNTYILLGIAILIVIGLILFVGIKRAQRNRLNRYDEENPRSTEMIDMNKDVLGKPIHKNGISENVPLIGEKALEDKAKPMNGNGKPTYGEENVDRTNLEPLLEEKSNQNGGTKQNTLEVEPPVHMVIPRYPPPKSPRASKYSRENDANNNDDDVFLPSSPKSGRYSPVYSPETGKVKIRLTETPRPKTPMLVTRSKSNAGEIITTPVTNNNSNSHNNNLVH